MNIDLGGAVKSKQTKKYGLNKREPKNNVFGGDDSSSEEEAPASSRAAVNRALQREQDALRKRARAAMTSDVYDYDGAYDEMHPTNASEKPEEPVEKKSRYVADLLKVSQARQQEREIILERKIAREQDVEDQQADFREKEKFVTSAYRDKLTERKAWLENDQRRTNEEEENDITKRKEGMANFYGNFSRNVAVGGKAHEKVTHETRGKKPAANSQEADVALERSRTDGSVVDSERSSSGLEAYSLADAKVSRREVREQKIAAARIRYFARTSVAVT